MRSWWENNSAEAEEASKQNLHLLRMTLPWQFKETWSEAISSVCILLEIKRNNIHKHCHLGSGEIIFSIGKSNVSILDVYFPTLQHLLSFPVSSTLLLLPSFPTLLWNSASQRVPQSIRTKRYLTAFSRTSSTPTSAYSHPQKAQHFLTTCVRQGDRRGVYAQERGSSSLWRQTNPDTISLWSKQTF